MKKISVLLFVLIAAVLVSGCTTMEAQPVQALGAPTTAPVANAPAPAQVQAPAAAAAAPAAALPARVEFPVKNDRMEIQVMGVEVPFHVDLGYDPYMAAPLSYKPAAGNVFVDLGLRVTNSTGSDIPLNWSDVYMTNKYQDKWYPIWGAYEQSNAYMNPLTVKILKYEQVNPDFDPDAHFYVGDRGYVRVIFELPRTNLHYWLAFSDLQVIEINWNQYR